MITSPGQDTIWISIWNNKLKFWKSVANDNKKNNTSRGEEYEYVLEIIFDFSGRFLFVKILECVLSL